MTPLNHAGGVASATRSLDTCVSGGAEPPRRAFPHTRPLPHRADVAECSPRLYLGSLAGPPGNVGVKGEGPTLVGPACGALDPDGAVCGAHRHPPIQRPHSRAGRPGGRRSRLVSVSIAVCTGGAGPPGNVGVKGEGPTLVGPACGALDPDGRCAAHTAIPPPPSSARTRGRAGGADS